MLVHHFPWFRCFGILGLSSDGVSTDGFAIMLFTGGGGGVMVFFTCTVMGVEVTILFAVSLTTAVIL